MWTVLLPGRAVVYITHLHPLGAERTSVSAGMSHPVGVLVVGDRRVAGLVCVARLSAMVAERSGRNRSEYALITLPGGMTRAGMFMSSP